MDDLTKNYHFTAWATKNDLKCADGRTIVRDAFKPQDGTVVPLCWGHKHDDVFHVLGHALLENRPEGVFMYGRFNDTDQGVAAKKVVENGDVNAVSIYANRLKHDGANVVHGNIIEVSLVLAGANPGAKIEDVFAHGDYVEDEGIVYTNETLSIAHADDKKSENKEESAASEEKKNEGKTVQDVIDSMTEKQKTAMAAIVGLAIEEAQNSEKEEDAVKHNFFDADSTENGATLSHADEESILKMAKTSSVGSLKTAIEIFAQNNEQLAHGFDSDTLDALFPEYKDVRPGAPELITRDQGWVAAVMNGVHKSPISRIRTRQMDVRDLDGTANLRGRGYNRSKNNGEKLLQGNAKLLSRTTDPQTVYVKDKLHRDDIIDITDFDVVNYQYGIMRMNLNEEVATAIMIGDGRTDGANDKISEDHIRSIWNDDELYTIHADVDIDAMKTSLQGSDTFVHFGENYIYAESIIQAALYAREDYKGSGQLDMFCTPHLLNVMLLARDLNGRRIYDSKSDLARALNVRNIYTVEQFEGKTRTSGTGSSAKTKKLLALMVDLNDYHVGSTKGGEISRFSQFDIDFNQEKYLIETRLSGANTRIKSAIALEEDVTESSSSSSSGTS